MPTQCAPSVLVYNDEKKQWKYLEKYMEEGNENSTLSTVYVVEDSNKKINILDLVKMIIKEYNENGD